MCENTYIGVWSFRAFRPGFSLWHTCHVVRHGHFTLKQLRLAVLNEMHTNSCTGPRLFGGKRGYADMQICGYADLRESGYADTSNWFNKQISKTQ